jgi:hypothetical protein
MPRPSNYNESARKPLGEFHDTGVNGYFRVLSNNLNTQNTLADNKANIIISISTVLLTIIMSSLAKNGGYQEKFHLPILFLMATSLISTIFAILVTRPTIRKIDITQEHLDKKETTLFFFGNFSSLSREDFEDTMLTIMKDDEYLFRSIFADFYGQGKVLNRKYRYLSYSYNTFLYGIIISVILFAVFSFL